MDEGYATYTAYICHMEHNIPGWSAAQYFCPVEDVAKPLIEGGEDVFEDFAKWYTNEWDKVVEKKMAEIEAMSN